MLKLTKSLSIGLCATMLMFSCSKDMEDVNPSSTLSGVSTDAAKAASTANTVAPLSISSLSTTDGKTWSFTVQKNAAVTEKLANVGSLMLTMMDCEDMPIMLSAANVASASITGKNGTYNQPLAPSYKEGNGSVCDMGTVTGYIRLTDFVEKLTDGSAYTVNITLYDAVRVKSGKVWARISNSCSTTDIVGPGCEEQDFCGEGHGYFHEVGSWEGHEVTLGGHTYTEAEGLALMNPNAGGGNKYIGFAFSQGATVELNKKLKMISARAYDSEMTAINAYLGGFDKLTASTAAEKYDGSPEATAAKTAAGYIGDNIDCE
ncbi:hypothetical protein ACFSRY_11150 [Pontibacter locisalis]|uniref:AZL_007920/MXAN_0976 family protein n=1 Tax=Pontibacter locisalis TaxID=1719035 RepID=A0ABW5ILY1_9BACT